MASPIDREGKGCANMGENLGTCKCPRLSKGKQSSEKIIKEQNWRIIYYSSLDDIHSSFIALVEDLKLKQLLDGGVLIDKNTRMLAEQGAFVKCALIDGIKDEKLLKWASTNFRAQLSVRMGEDASVDSNLQAMKDPGQSTPRLETMKAAQLIGVQTVLFSVSNTMAIHEDIQQMEFWIMCRLDSIWKLQKAQAKEKIVQGRSWTPSLLVWELTPRRLRLK